MDTTTVASIASIVGVFGIGFSYMRDRLKGAEELGQLKQKIITLENQVSSYNNRFETSSNKMDKVLQKLHKIEAWIHNLEK